MFLPHLLKRKSLLAEVRELDKLFLNLLQPFLPVTMSDVGFRSLLVSKAILFIQLLDVCNLRSKTPNLFPKNFKMIHTVRITHPLLSSVGGLGSSAISKRSSLLLNSISP